MPKVVLYNLIGSPPCRAVLMAARELGIDLEIKEMNFGAGEHLKPEFLQINPEHTVPTIDDNGYYLWESRTIMRYLANKYAPDSQLYPKDPQKRATVDRLLDFDYGKLYKEIADYLFPEMLKGLPRDPEKEEQFKNVLGFLNTYLEKSKYVAGDNLTLADLSILASLQVLEVADYDYSAYSHVRAWFERLRSELPYYKDIHDKANAAFKAWVKQNQKK